MQYLAPQHSKYTAPTRQGLRSTSVNRVHDLGPSWGKVGWDAQTLPILAPGFNINHEHSAIPDPLPPGLGEATEGRD